MGQVARRAMRETKVIKRARIILIRSGKLQTDRIFRPGQNRSFEMDARDWLRF